MATATKYHIGRAFLAFLAASVVCNGIQADYEIRWYVVGAGGGASAGGFYELQGTVGHGVLGESAGGAYQETGGFWSHDGLCAAVQGSPLLLIDRSDADLVLSWSVSPQATSYDVIRGDLTLLWSTAGDFQEATDGCIADNVSTTSTIIPIDGLQRFFLVRAASCAGAGSYDTTGTAQAGSRDGEIAGSSGDCP